MIEILPVLIEILRDDLSVDAVDISDDSHLLGDLGFDSVMFAIALVSIEERFEIPIAAQDLQNCETVGAVASLIEKSLSSHKISQ